MGLTVEELERGAGIGGGEYRAILEGRYRTPALRRLLNYLSMRAGLDA